MNPNNPPRRLLRRLREWWQAQPPGFPSPAAMVWHQKERSRPLTDAEVSEAMEVFALASERIEANRTFPGMSGCGHDYTHYDGTGTPFARCPRCNNYLSVPEAGEDA